jgi:hypothetical protein
MRTTMRARVRCRVACFGLTWATALIVLLLVAIPVFAQAPTGVILGVVKDASGGSIAGATVTVVNTETGLTRTLTTAEDGAYRFPALPVGHYSVNVERSGFKPETHEGLILNVSQEEALNFTLEVGAATQEVVVTGEAPQVGTTNATMGGTVDEQKMADLPLNGRNYIELTLLQPGVAHAAMAGNIAVKTQGTWISSDGAPVRSNNITLDGARLNNAQGSTSASAGGYTLGVDGIREYKVVTQMFGAEYGLGMGSQVVMVSRGGTNRFHGDAFDYLRNDALDARNFFDTGSFKPPLRKNNFGGSFGGPIKKDKAFFYAVYEGVRETVGQSIHDHVLPASCYDSTSQHNLLGTAAADAAAGTTTTNPCMHTNAGQPGDVFLNGGRVFVNGTTDMGNLRAYSHTPMLATTLSRTRPRATTARTMGRSGTIKTSHPRTRCLRDSRPTSSMQRSMRTGRSIRPSKTTGTTFSRFPRTTSSIRSC